MFRIIFYNFRSIGLIIHIQKNMEKNTYTENKKIRRPKHPKEIKPRKRFLNGIDAPGDNKTYVF